MLIVCSQVDIEDGPFPPHVAAVLKAEFNLRSQEVWCANYESEYITKIEDAELAAHIVPQIERFASRQQHFAIPVGALEVWSGSHPRIVLRLNQTKKLSSFETDLENTLGKLDIKPSTTPHIPPPILDLHLSVRNIESEEAAILKRLFDGIALSAEVQIKNVCIVSDAIDLAGPGRFTTALLGRFDFPAQ